MNEIRLFSMEYRNFKGIKKFLLNLNSFNASVFGDNATYKSTLYDGYLWLLFGKDSQGRANFQIKPQDENGEEIHFLESMVEGILSLNGQELKLKRMLSEKWATKRGSEKKEYEGNETSYWVNDVPVKAGEYANEINAVIKENAFKLLTNPLFFNSDTKGAEWQDRRKILFEISGDVSDETVIASDEKLAGLSEILAGKSIDNFKKILIERIKKVKGSIEEIPIKINELSRTVLSEDVNYPVVDAKLLEHKAELKTIEQSMTDASLMASTYRQKQQDAFKLSTAIEDRKKELDASAMVGLKRAIDEKSKLEGEKYRLNVDIKSTEAKIKSSEKLIIENDADLVKLRAEWNVENAKQFIEPDPTVFICPTCEQPFPQDKKDLRIAQMIKNFDYNKAQELEKINARGRGIGVKQTTISDDIEALNTVLTNYGLDITLVTERLTELDKEVEDERQRTFGANYDSDQKYSILNSQLQAIKLELNKPIEDTTTELLQQKNEVTEQINALNKLLNNRDVAIKTKARIDELKGEERTLSSQLSEFERQRYLIEQFVKTKVSLLEGNMNSKFKTIRFRLFETLQEGQVKEVCKTLINTNGKWVEWQSGNNAGRINAGLDIISTLSRHYGVLVPIFIDNQESVTEPFKMDAQTINLVVSYPDKTLRVEVA